MNSYLIYLIISATTIASPGPGVVMTLTNSLKYGVKDSFSGVLGVAVGMFFIALAVGGGLGVIVTKSDNIYSILKIVGALYLMCLGIRLLLNRNKEIEIQGGEKNTQKRRFFFQGLGITIINPKPILFFLALFPQFIKEDNNYYLQFSLLTISFCSLILLVHLFYGLFANIINNKSQHYNYFKLVNTFGGIAYIIFSISLILF